MIPKRIKLSGFLSYRDEQELVFDGSPLWMLSGPNGSGKSSIFDSVTYALFGHHRGGTLGAAELINKAENGFTVEFDFLLDGVFHRIKRTLKRRSSGSASTQQVFRWEGHDFLPVADTQRKVEFDAWIANHIGLSYDTFTSSVLLLQGRAERLLDSTAKGRAEVLASIVDLQRYQRLHERADSRRKSLKGQVEALQNQLAAIPEVTEIELVAARHRIDEMQEVVEHCQREVERLQGFEFEARRWADVERKLAAAHLRKAKAARILQEARDIERDLARFNELREVLPHLEVIAHRLNDIRISEDRTKAVTGELRKLNGQLARVEHQLEEMKLQRENLQKNIATDEQKSQQIAARLPQLSVMLERVNTLEQREGELNKLQQDFDRLPRDLATRISDVQAEIDELTHLERSLAPLERFAAARSELAASLRLQEKSRHAEAMIKSKGEEIRKRFEALKPLVEAARLALSGAEAEAASFAALQKQAEEQRAALDSLDGAKNCSACGQKLTAKHLRDEKETRDQAVLEAKKRAQEALVRVNAARVEARTQSELLAGVERDLHATRDQFGEARSKTGQADRDVTRLQLDCRRWYGEVEESLRSRIAAIAPDDWTATVFPEAAELDTVRRRLLELPAKRRELDHARDLLNRSNHLSQQLDQMRGSVATLRASIEGDPAKIRTDVAWLDSQRQSLIQSLTAARQADQLAQQAADRLSTEFATTHAAISERNGQLQTEGAKRDMCEQAITAARKAMRSDWLDRADQVGLQEFNRLRGEREDLEGRGVEARAEQLRSSRAEADSLNRTVEDLERERDTFVPEARRDLLEVQREVTMAKAHHEQQSKELNAAINARANLDAREQQRHAVRGQVAESERELKRFKTLAELLGRDRLQRHLLRQAERQIVEYANGVLDRLSSGLLMLRLVGSEDGAPADAALELECVNRATGESPISVTFLSGSQRFRVAVSLALGIGQYASRLHRPIESVIIDEGFGCLDTIGRGDMIKELHKLREQLKCIMLVSHQEEFADAFADGYRFELVDGATRVTRIQR